MCAQSPRVGQEVLLNFINGYPNQPIISDSSTGIKGSKLKVSDSAIALKAAQIKLN
ncbi:hypothetical protein [Thalassomonas haliotis]|uniref:Uncharacterized protein n=1 Tax=Thalassomonas haliotis TaxID=485448 RepID=A0ABY7V7V0_9GAMM|nr:hypothetical protein [Thalassomonas haliotis]WDE09739.1 hypothetical protein H3N35_15580 [Thalassomonas haliotis]